MDNGRETIAHLKSKEKVRRIIDGLVQTGLLIVIIIIVGTGIFNLHNAQLYAERRKYNTLPISEFTFTGPHAEELSAKINTLLREHRTKVPTGSIALHGNLMWLRTPEGKTPYGLAVQFQTGSGVYAETLNPRIGTTYVDKAASGILYDLGLVAYQYRRSTR